MSRSGPVRPQRAPANSPAARLAWSWLERGRRLLRIGMVRLRGGRYLPSMTEPTPDGQVPKDALTRAVNERNEGLPGLIRAQYDSLLAMAQRIHGGGDKDISPDSMVHEAYVRLVDQSQVAAGSVTFFRACFAQECRRVLVDQARRRKALRRGGGRAAESLADQSALGMPGRFDLVEVNDAIEGLAKLDARMARIVDMRVFGGLTIAECAAELGISPRQVDSDWAFARSYLQSKLR